MDDSGGDGGVFDSIVVCKQQEDAAADAGLPSNVISHIHTNMCIQVFCWVAQFVGHGVFEGRAPALLDNLVQALFMAPVFVLLEVRGLVGS